MARIRSILKPAKEGKNVTLSEARSAFRELGTNAKADGRLPKTVVRRLGSKATKAPAKAR